MKLSGGTSWAQVGVDLGKLFPCGMVIGAAAPQKQKFDVEDDDQDSGINKVIIYNGGLDVIKT